MRVIIPGQFRARSLFSLVDVQLGRLENVPREVIFDFSGLQFSYPSGVVFLSNLVRYLERNGSCVQFHGMRTNTESIRFLDDSLFFEQHIGQKLIARSTPRHTTRPLQEIRHERSHAWLRGDFIPWLSECSGRSEDSLAEVTTCVAELFNNIKDHSEFDVGSVFAQWFPKIDRVDISIADFGAGIPTTVGRIEAGLSDEESILKAFEDGFSSRSTPRNRGVGLYLLKQNVVERFGGALTVRSHGAAVRFEKVGNMVRTVAYTQRGFCPGTMIDIEFRTDLIEEECDERTDVEW